MTYFFMITLPFVTPPSSFIQDEDNKRWNRTWSIKARLIYYLTTRIYFQTLILEYFSWL